MFRTTFAALVITVSLSLLLLSILRADDKPTLAAREYQALIDEVEQEGSPRRFVKRFLALAKEHEKDPAAVDALVWVVSNVRGRTDTDAALALLAKRHVSSKKLGPACEDIARSRSAQAEPLLRLLLDKSPHNTVRARAGYYLATLLELEAGIVDQLKAQPELAPRVLQYYGKPYGNHLASLEAATLEQQREELYERLLSTFPNVEIQDDKVADVARAMLFRMRHLSVGKVAPDIQGEDIHGKSFKLSDYRGKVVMLTFWGHW